MIPFTRRELVVAWSAATKASQVVPRSNAHRLLLFYAVECGLKAVYLKNQNLDLLDAQTAAPLAHDVNRVLDLLRADIALRIRPDLMQLPALQRPRQTRICHAKDLNQVWRYGGQLRNPTDQQVEKNLDAIQQWIAKELQ